MKKTLLLIILLFSLSISSYSQLYLREREGNKLDTLSTKTDTTQNTPFKMMDTHVDYDVEKYFNTDMSEEERKKHKAAIEFFNKRLMKDSNDVAALMNRGAYLANLGLHVQAIKDYNKAIRLAPDQPMLYYNRALSKARFMYTLDACKDLKKSNELNFSQAGSLMETKCGRYKVELSSDTTLAK